MEQLEGILKIVDKELKTINENGEFRSKEEIDATYKLIDVAKDIYCIWEYENSGMDDEEMSFAGGSYERGGGRSYRGGSYDDGSYARGRGRNAKRNSMGRYSRESGYSRDGSYRMGYSRDGGKEEFVEQLREMMQEAPDESSRQSIQRMIQKMEQE